MPNLWLDSERVSPTGNILSQGILNQLGRPGLNNLAILVREAVQNSWDARLSDRRTVYFEIGGWTLDLKGRQFIRDHIFSNTPPAKTLSINKVLRSNTPINFLAIYDRGTTGLGGPTRADELTNDKEPRDFVDFLRNIGQPPNKKLSGGTYGYGKAAFYRASTVRTICIYTRCKYKGKTESRFFVSGLGLPFESNKIKYTGRHWWGRKNRGIAEPILGSDADLIANKLGIRVFGKDEFGIVQPDLANNSSDKESSGHRLANALTKIAEYLVWYFWPKMLKHKGNLPMSFNVTWEGQQISIPNPAEYLPTKPFVQAMHRLKNEKTSITEAFKHNIIEINSQRPLQILGRLALQAFPTEQPTFSENGQENGIPKLCSHHVALMRQPELIVKYYEGPSMGTESLGYAGVFVSDQEVDTIFAESEPPTHDDWVPDSLNERVHKVFVRVALRNIFREMESFSRPFSIQIDQAQLLPLGGFSTRLANSVFPTITGWSANTDTPSTEDTSKYEDKDSFSKPEKLNPSVKEVDSLPQNLKTNLSGLSIPPTYPQAEQEKSDLMLRKKTALGRSRVKLISDGNFLLVNGKRSLQIDFIVKHASSSSGSNIKAVPRALIDGGQNEVEPPIGGSQPEILLWINPNGERYVGADEVFVSSSSDGVWHVIISIPDDIVLGIDFKAEAKV